MSFGNVNMKGKLFTFCFHFSLHYFASMEIKIVISQVNLDNFGCTFMIAWWNCCIIHSGGHTKIATWPSLHFHSKNISTWLGISYLPSVTWKTEMKLEAKRTENFAKSILLKMTLGMSISTFLCTFSWYVLLYFALCFVFLWNLIFTRMHIVALICEGRTWKGPKDYYVM